MGNKSAGYDFYYEKKGLLAKQIGSVAPGCKVRPVNHLAPLLKSRLK
ncbi:hypothetical protein [Alloalcanivorax mobilis]|nr:hypothetical protein [Alloalcanivorax mobilis]|tara:strand:- start:775 stop:915 length:141 start_codon:yes stop_codon:yes gene_type:complete